jgi:hypothetical protein
MGSLLLRRALPGNTVSRSAVIVVMTVQQLLTQLTGLGLGGLDESDSQVVFKDGTPLTTVATDLTGKVILS